MIIFNAGKELFLASSTFWSYDRYLIPGLLMDEWFHVTSSDRGIMPRTDLCHFWTRGEFNPWSERLQSAFPFFLDGDH